jgi:hypothetical protein
MTTRLAPDRTPHLSPIALATTALLIGALALVAGPLLGTAVVVSTLGALAAVVALAAVAALIHLVATDLWSDVRRALGRGTGRHLATYHAARRAR